MKVNRSIDRLPQFKNAVITIGTFDGVHNGHRQIIRQLKDEANKIDGETVIITFDPHPRMVIPSPKQPVQLLNTLDEKISLLEQEKINHLVVVPFTKAFSEQSAEDYIRNFLVKSFRPHTIIIGYDHHFGKDRKGDYHLLEDFRDEFHYSVKEIPEEVLNEVAISSTRIREALLASDITTANESLGYPYFFEGLIVEGNKMGRTIGYPTANLVVADKYKLIPGNGVYAVTVNILNTYYQDTLFKGMMNIGLRPTVDGKTRAIEVNIFDFDKEIYGKKLKVSCHKLIRHEIKFNGLEELKVQLAKDKETSIQLLGEL